MEKSRNLLLGQNPAAERSPDFPLQFNKQDFVKLRNDCLDQGLLFEDDTFPANNHSIGLDFLRKENLKKVQWLRPPELVENPSLFVDGISRFDIIQGRRIGNCWVLAALGSLTQQQRFLENVIPKDQGFNYTYAGIFHFQFWHFGDWVDVVVDDRLPFCDGDYLSVKPRSKNEFWPSLLEKAYAKWRGSYEKLHFGFISEALVDLTGGVQLPFSLRSSPTHLFEIMKTAALSGCLMACDTPEMKTQVGPVLKDGIVQQHVYTVTDAREVPYMNTKEHLIKIWNPWGSMEWNGAWSDDSVEWDRVPQQFKTEFYVNRVDGEFWMSFKDFKDNFSSLFVCNNTPTFLDFGEESNTSWSVVKYINQFSPEGSNYLSALSRNHQYSIKIPEFMMRRDNVVVALTQTPANNSQKLVPIGYCIEKDELQGRTTVHNTQLALTRDVTYSHLLNPGDYIIIPIALPQSQESNFLLRIFLKSQDDLREPNTGPSSVVTKRMLKWNPDNYENIFLRYAYQNSYLDASQLQRILNEVLLKGKTHSFICYLHPVVSPCFSLFGKRNNRYRVSNINWIHLFTTVGAVTSSHLRSDNRAPVKCMPVAPQDLGAQFAEQKDILIISTKSFKLPTFLPSVLSSWPYFQYMTQGKREKKSPLEDKL